MELLSYIAQFNYAHCPTHCLFCRSGLQNSQFENCHSCALSSHLINAAHIKFNCCPLEMTNQLDIQVFKIFFGRAHIA